MCEEPGCFTACCERELKQNPNEPRVPGVLQVDNDSFWHPSGGDKSLLAHYNREPKSKVTGGEILMVLRTIANKQEADKAAFRPDKLVTDNC